MLAHQSQNLKRLMEHKLEAQQRIFQGAIVRSESVQPGSSEHVIVSSAALKSIPASKHTHAQTHIFDTGFLGVVLFARESGSFYDPCDIAKFKKTQEPN